jgi:hypothetical protein
VDNDESDSDDGNSLDEVFGITSVINLTQHQVRYKVQDQYCHQNINEY